MLAPAAALDDGAFAESERGWVLSQSCLGSVDNQFPILWGSFHTFFGYDIGVAAARANATNRFLILARVEGVDAFDEDPEVHVRLYRAFAAPGTACTSPSMGDTYQIDRLSLRSGGSVPEDSVVDLVGAIHHGRLRAAASEREAFTILWPSGRGDDSKLSFVTHQVTIAVNLDQHSGSQGNFGGWITGPDFMAAFTEFDPRYVDAYRAVVGGFMDIQRDGVCEDTFAMPPRHAAMSIGFGFDAVRVQLDPAHPVVEAPMPGSCELTAGTDAGRD